MAIESATVSSLPWPYTPPTTIDESTTNTGVRLYVCQLLCQYNEDLSAHEAWVIAGKLNGDGRAVLRADKEAWIRRLGDYGTMVYEEMESQKYVDVN